MAVTLMNVLLTRPYDAINIIGFENADRIALAMDFKPQKEERIDGAALYALNVLRAKNNSIIVPKAAHREAMRKLLDMNVPKGAVKPDMMNDSITRLKAKRILAGANEYFYLREDWRWKKTWHSESLL